MSLECEKSELEAAAAASAKRGQILKLAQQNIFTLLLCLFCCLQKLFVFIFGLLFSIYLLQANAWSIILEVLL